MIDLLPEQKEVEDLGGTMRLGAQAVELADGTRTREVYGDEPVISERHRHRYEVNNAYRQQLRDGGLVISGTFQEGRLVEIVELPDHPWFVASQFHPEFKSRPTRPAPLFREFVSAALDRARTRSGVSRERRLVHVDDGADGDEDAHAGDDGRAGDVAEANVGAVLARQLGDSELRAGVHQLLELTGGGLVPGDVRQLQSEQLVARVAEHQAGGQVRGHVVALLVGDEHGERRMLGCFAEQGGLDQRLGDAHLLEI